MSHERNTRHVCDSDSTRNELLERSALLGLCIIFTMPTDTNRQLDDRHVSLRSGAYEQI